MQVCEVEFCVCEVEFCACKLAGWLVPVCEAGRWCGGVARWPGSLRGRADPVYRARAASMVWTSARSAALLSYRIYMSVTVDEWPRKAKGRPPKFD